MEAVSGRFNPHVHVEYDWNLRLDELDESDDELDDKVTPSKQQNNRSTDCFVLFFQRFFLAFCLH